MAPAPPGASVEAPAPAWHALAPVAAAARLGCDLDGLAHEEVTRRRDRWGPNRLPEAPRRSLWRLLLGQLQSPLIYLLLVAAGISIALGHAEDSLFIFVVLALNTGVGALQEARAEADTAALKHAITTHSRVARDGTVVLRDSAELVPGDLVLLEAGDRVPADLRLVRASDLETSEAALTGESLPVEKSAAIVLPDEAPLAERANMVFAGTNVLRGQAQGLVVASGRDTALGHIAQALDTPATPPPLSRRLERFSRMLGAATLVLMGVIIVGRLMAGAGMVETFLMAAALAVAVIPEGLPVAVTIALSVATRRMARRHVIVRHLPAVEGLGACTVIATDKTGTLTLNRMSATRLVLPSGMVLQVPEDEHDPPFRSDNEHGDAGTQAQIDALAVSVSLCNDATLHPVSGRQGASGDTVDIALLVLAQQAGLLIEATRSAQPRLAHLPFSAERRLAASLNADGAGAVLHVKGAAETVLPLCGAAGEVLLARAEAMAREGQRVLAIARRRLDVAPGETDNFDGWLQHLQPLGLVGFIDPLRPEAKDAVAACHRAGIAVKMITGDHAATALAIARDLGIAHDEADVMTGRELAALQTGSEAAMRRIERTRVFARVEPTQKLEIVDALQAAGHVVAMTGDGVNDAPALRRADLGIAMGLGGTDVARDSAALVIADDNLASVVAGVEEGRAAYANIRKLIFLLVSIGAAEVVLFLLAVALQTPVPLTTVQLLWLNLVANGAQDVTLALEKPEPGLLDRRPRAPREPIFDALMIRRTLLSSLFMGCVAFAFFWCWLAQGLAPFEARNALLFLMVLFANVQAFNARSETRSVFLLPPGANWPLMAAIFGAQAVQVLASYVPGVRDVLEIAPIPARQWLELGAVALGLLLLMETDKAFSRHRLGTPQPIPRV
ncbi:MULTISPECIES: cation-translocating P-type ATPase [unclassified Xanthobacter]|uniref:cation-translocating P-type ATPase n=1 Tax=unclassified Xanthobacter TaxID=2623496 RepID=UPI001EDF042C|nr:MULTISPECIES: HAD-IC family P-type ATPase [unclassified Xanthobacter]